MALSGSFTGSIQSGHYAIRVDWSASQDIANNRTTITCYLYFVNDWSIDIGARINTITIAGTSYSLSSPAYSTKGTHYIGSCSKIIDHNSDGSLGKVSISAVFNIKATLGETYYASISASDSVSINTIPRASIVSLSSQNFNIGDNVWLYTNRKSTAFSHDLYLQRNDGTYGNIIVTQIGDSINIANYPTVINSLYSESHNKKERAGRFLLYTYNGSTKIGESFVDFTAKVPENSSTKPTVTMSISPVPLADWVETDYVQGRSQVKAEMTASPKLYSKIESYNVTVDGKTTTLTTESGSAAVTTQVLNNSGTFSVVGKSIDTRDIPSEEVSEEITVIPYGKPYITNNSAYGSIVCARYDEEKGVMADNGTSIKLIIGTKWYSLSKKENTATLEVKCVSGTIDSGWIPIDAVEQGGGAENNYISYFDINTVIPGVTVSVDKTYQIYIRCTDRFGAYNSDSETPYRIPTEDVCFHLGKYGNKAAFGKYAERDKTVEIDQSWDLILKGGIIADFIVEQGTSGIWNYRKWNNGTYECWCNYKDENFKSEQSVVGGLYLGYGTLNFPITFVQLPTVTYSVINTTGYDFSGKALIGYGYFNYYVGSTVEQQSFCNISAYVIGRWKKEEY